MTLRDYLRVVRAHRVLIVGIAVLFALVAFVVSSRQETIYAAEANIAFSDPARDLELLGTPISPERAPAERAAIGADLVERNTVVRRVGLELGMRDLRELRQLVTARPEARTNFVVIEAQTGDPRDAAELANAFARAVRDYVVEQERRRYDRITDGLRREYAEAGRRANSTARALFADRIARVEALRDFARPVEIAKTAGVPSTPASPRTLRNTLLALVLGLVLGLLVAFGRDTLDRRLRTTADVRETLGLPLVGQLSELALGASPLPVNGHRQLSVPDAEAVRILRTNLEFLDPQREMRVLLVSSAGAKEGKSTTASSLAVAAARAGQRTLLIECDLRQPSMSDRLGVRRAPGLADVLTGKATFEEVEQTLKLKDGASIACVTAGARTDSPSELLRSPGLRSLLADARERFDLVVLDGTPLLYVVDARELVPLADALLLCVRAALTTHEQARAAQEALARLPDLPTGLVVTGIRPDDEATYGYYASAERAG